MQKKLDKTINIHSLSLLLSDTSLFLTQKNAQVDISTSELVLCISFAGQIQVFMFFGSFPLFASL